MTRVELSEQAASSGHKTKDTSVAHMEQILLPLASAPNAAAEARKQRKAALAELRQQQTTPVPKVREREA